MDFFKSSQAKELEAARDLREKELIKQHEGELQSMQ
jgi:hypothetical protein